MGNPVPVILTERLKLRGVEKADFDALVAHWSHPVTVRFIGGEPRAPSLVWTRSILNSRGMWSLLGYGYWYVEDRKTGEFVGEVGFSDFHRDTTPTFWGVPECGWVIAPDHHRKGYASEAVGAIHKWFDEEADEPESVCIIDDDNAPSIRIAEKLGYQRAGHVDMNGEAVGFYKRKRGGQKA